jgi:hypothetical protein
MLDPKTLTPESLYKLQSETWVQGADAERERIVKLIQDTYADEAYEELGSLEWTGDIIALIQT